MSSSELGTFSVDELQDKITAVLRRAGSDAVWGYAVHSVRLNREVASNENADAPFIPASNVKLMTCAAALHVSHVGPCHRYETRAWVESDGGGERGAGETRDERVLCVEPSGDPSLSTQDVRKLVRRAIAGSLQMDLSVTGAGAGSGVGAEAGGRSWATQGNGNAKWKMQVKLVGREWKDEGPHSTWEVGDLDEPWAAPPSRAVIDGNLFRTSDACAARAQPYPLSPCAHFISRVGDIANADSDSEGEYHDEDDNEDLRTRGKTTEQQSTVSIHLSRPVATIVRQALEDSNNLCAEQLLRTAAGGKDSGRWLTSWSAVFVNQQCPKPLNGLSTVPRRIRLVDGSGLSRHNLAPPRAFVALLRAVLEGAQLEKVEMKFPRAASAPAPSYPNCVFLDSLPIAGRTGTLSKRFVGTAAEGTVRAKTGSMTGVAALSGIFQPPGHSDSETMVFSIIANNAVGHTLEQRERVRAVIDEIVVLIANAR